MPPASGDRVAIVGMGCILPGGIESPTELWDFLCQGGDAVTEVPADRWNLDAVYSPDRNVPGTTSTRRGAFLKNISHFDPTFFNLSLREAEVMDPQQRLLLEASWRAIEDAGIPSDRLAGTTTGVYIGISHSDYHAIQQFGRRLIDLHSATGGALSIAAARISHRFDLRGPSLAIDTACSSSLVALDAACSDLLQAKSEMAIVGGVNAILTPDVTITFSRANMLSPDGRCKAFDARADGYVRGEGVGVVLLKLLSKAQADGDRIHAVIASTAVNQDGRTSTITVPSLDAQVAMLRGACHKANIDPARIAYVEAHGTGTPVGDPVEATAVGTVFGTNRAAGQSCLIGSIKTNIGHLEPAAGIVGLIKAALCIRERAIPASLHFETPNPHIDFEKLAIAVAQSHIDWPGDGPRVAAVNSFGFGGTNACAIVTQADEHAYDQPSTQSTNRPVLLACSGASEKGRAFACTAVAGKLRDGGSIEDIAGTLALRRDHLDYRCVITARSRQEAITSLEAIGRGETTTDAFLARKTRSHRVAFVFTGQGAQWAGMGRELLSNDVTFRKAVLECDALFKPLAGCSILELLERGDDAAFDLTEIAQPTTFAVQVGLAASLAALGVRPECVIGHSIGEIAAAYVGGALSLEEAVQVVLHRSQLQASTRFLGGMAAIGLSLEAVKARLSTFTGSVEIAAVNAPELVTVAGGRHDVSRFVKELRDEQEDTFCQILRIDYAFHSTQMDALKAELRDRLRNLKPRSLRLPMISTVTGNFIDGSDLDANYWCDNMREPVQFKAAVHRAIEDNFSAFVELGPHPALSSSVSACLEHCDTSGIVVQTLRRDLPQQKDLTHVFALLHVNGAKMDWKAVTARDWRFVELAGALFERVPCWAESEESRRARLDGPAHPLLGFRASSASPVWLAEIDENTPHYLAHHRVDGSVVFPASAYVELMLAAAREILGLGPCEITQVKFREALSLGQDGSILVETSIGSGNRIEIRTRARNEPDWVLRADAVIRSWSMPASSVPTWTPRPEPPLYAGNVRFYRELLREGHEFGPAFQGVKTVWGEENEGLGRVALPDEAGDSSRYLLHPALLDACFQCIRAFQSFAKASNDLSLALPTSIESVRLFCTPGKTVYSRVRSRYHTDFEIVADIDIIGENGGLVASIKGFCCQRVGNRSKTSTLRELLYEEVWIEHADATRSTLQPEIPSSDECWLIVLDRTGLGLELCRRLRRRGLSCTTVLPAQVGRFANDHKTGDFTRIVDLSALDTVSSNATSFQRRWAAHALTLLALLRRYDDIDRKPLLCIVTAGGAPSDRNHADAGRAIINAAITGFIRSLANEAPGFHPTVINLDPNDVAADLIQAELLSCAASVETAIRNGKRFECRLRPILTSKLPAKQLQWTPGATESAFQLTMSAPGILDNLRCTLAEVPKPAAGEVMIEVKAVGLNFRDVMAASGLLPVEAEALPAWQRLGYECAGIVRKVGANVDPSLIGKRVVAVSPGCCASHFCVAKELVFIMPRSLSYSDAAAIPVAYSTAYYALDTLARLAPGERVLIHAASGGVGLAAIAIAKARGAEIYATAGSDSKRDYLRRLGVAHVFDSRSLASFDEILAATAGEGVDVVLNSLSGDFLKGNFKVLAPGARFLEIGKSDVYLDTTIGLRSLKKNVSLFVIDLAQLMQAQPQLLRSVLESVFKALRSGDLPPLPTQSFPIAVAADAFRTMAAAKHVGKIVLSLDSNAEIVSLPRSKMHVSANGIYLVTGGTRGLGLATAQWLVARGARHLAIIGRSNLTPESDAIFAEMRSQGVRVEVFACDVSRRQAIADVLRRLHQTKKPLLGIVHAAGIIDDALAKNLSAQSLARVFEPKVVGAWNLHALTKNAPLDFFVMFSSIAESIGSIGQAHYAAANRALHALATLRRSERRPALAISLGPISDCGHLLTRPDLGAYLGRAGVRPITSADLLACLEVVLQTDASTIAYADIDWGALCRSHESIGTSARTAELAPANIQSTDRMGRDPADFLRSVGGAKRQDLARAYLRRQVSRALKCAEDMIDSKRPLGELGLDSLTSFELKNRIESDLGISLSIAKIIQRPTIESIATEIGVQLDLASSTNPIERDAAKRTVLEMSPGQEALWYIDRLHGGANTAYCLASAVAVRPKLIPEFAESAWQYVVARHESLRTAFDADSYGPVPYLIEATQLKIKWHDTTHLDSTGIQRLLDRHANTPFMLARNPLVQVHIFQCRDRDVLLFYVHHIVSDAASLSILAEELFDAYIRLRSGAKPQYPSNAVSFRSFASWQRQLVESTDGDRHRTYWRKQLAGCPLRLSLPTPRAKALRGEESKAFRFKLEPETLTDLKRLAQSAGTTLFCVLLAAFKILLHRETGEIDIVVGTPVSNRTRPEFENIVGYLANALPIRTRLQPHDSIRDLLLRVSETVHEALEHQNYPFAAIVHDLGTLRSVEHTPLFQVMFGMERAAAIDAKGFSVTLLNTEGPRIRVGDIDLSAVNLRRERAQFDLSFAVEEFNDELLGVVDYRSSLWDTSDIELLTDHYCGILRECLHPAANVAARLQPSITLPCLVSGPELHDIPDVVDSFRWTATSWPDRCAVRAADGQYNYSQLIARAESIASTLAANAIGPGALVAIHLSRSKDLPATLMAVLSTGAAYLALDPSHPLGRLTSIVEDAKPTLIVVDREAALTLQTDIPRLQIADIATDAAMSVKTSVQTTDLAYVMYTSGSTGRPIGVEVTRGALSNFLAAMRQLRIVVRDDRLLAVTTMAFDIAFLELLLPLTIGASVTIDNGKAQDGRRLATLLASDGITVVQATPATWQMLRDANWAGNHRLRALCGGEALPKDLAQWLRPRTAALWNLYGPTETTVWSTAYEIKDDGSVAIGFPIANTYCRVVDEDLRPVAPRQPGELLIGGAGLARGYRNNPSRTEERFIIDPVEPSTSRFVFRTRDIVQQRADGALLYLGRTDRQIKLRGVRIEPEEIEIALRALPDVVEASVVAVQSTLPDKRLVGFVVLDHSRVCSFSMSTALQSLRAQLPVAMLPSAIQVLDALPRLPNSKLDYQKLVELASKPSGLQPSRREPDQIETQLTMIVANILGRKTVGLDEDFFFAGGTSLLGMRYVARASQAFGIDLEVSDLLGAPTIASLANRIRDLMKPGQSYGSTNQRTYIPPWKPLALAKAEGAFAHTEAAAIAYLPDDARRLFKSSQASIASGLRAPNLSSYWTAVCDTSLGAIALIVLPQFGIELMAEAEAAVLLIDEGIAHARRIGAESIALTGILPSITGLGTNLNGHRSLVTTGHPTTVCAMVRTIESSAQAAGRHLGGERVAFLGVGAIGTATLHLMLDKLPCPRRIILCDVPAKRSELEGLARELGTRHRCRIDCIVSPRASAPDEIYDATLIVGASNLPDLIDIERLRPGTVLVDDSFPHCFDLTRAQRRIERNADILVVDGGRLFVPGATRWHVAAPPQLAGVAGGALSYELNPAAGTVTGCILSSLLTRMYGAPATIGPTTLAASRQHWDLLERLDIKSAPLHCGPISYSTEWLHGFRERSGVTGHVL